ncbi:FAD-binding oxidoreductase [Allobranchiibius sp. GilTou38]|uniref:FAD-dependent oxidoreductase n=1 Tax=Allobranchiibius sp. GilTou38 TaxID=2815210 RepID=UPI001AA13297|nr:FAD-binding oxidoreductase [Allobranchiibius sp. GilTou38]MBO1766435.1 FAD-binding oxidoreductase [Allobranchiibius sp. GilTou38]
MDHIDRRAFLAVTAAGAAAAALAGCSPTSSRAAGSAAAGGESSSAGLAATSSSGQSAAAGATGGPTLADWKQLAGQIQGVVLLPGSTPYAQDKLLFNPEYDGAKPQAVIRPKTTTDVQRSIAFSSKYGLHVSPRSGGHSYIGASAADGTVVIDLREMAAVDASGSSVSVQAGANLYSVHATLAGRNRTIPTGTCPTVGTSGLTLGGGLGTESRAHGLTCDRVESVQLVLPDSSLVTATASTNSDLYWAARGGSSAIPGVVTSLGYGTYSTTDRGIFRATFPVGSATQVLEGWASWLGSASRDWWANVHLDLSGGSLRPSILGVCTAGRELLALSSLQRHIGARATSTSHFQRSYLSTVQYFGGGTTSARAPFTAGTDLVRTMTSSAAAAIVQGTLAAGHRSVAAIVDPLDGAVHDVAVSAGAFPWRSHQASIQWYAGGSDYAGARSWISAAHSAVRSVSVGGYVNYLESGVAGSRYFAENTSKLNSVHQKYDPHGLMHLPFTL